MGCTTASPSIEASDSSGQSIKSSSSPKPGRESARQSAPGSSLPDRRTFLRDASRLGAAALAWAPASALPVTALGGVPVGPGRLRKVRDFDIRKHPRYYYGPGPSPVIFPDGEILLAFRRHPAAARKHTHIETENFVVSSRDGGKTWGTPVSVDYGGVHNVNLTLLADGSVLYCTSVMETVTRAAYERVRALPQERVPGGAGRYRLSYSAEELGTYAVISGVSVRRSSDRGRTWSPRYWVSPIDGVPSLLPGAPSPANLRSPVIQLRNGRLLLPVYSYPNPWRVALMESADLGKTWSFLGEIAGPSDPLELPSGALVDGAIAYNETFVQETPSGKLVAFIRIHAGVTERQSENWGGPVNPAGRLVTAVSDDGGRIWSAPARHRLWGYPYWATAMPSGRILLAYGYRQDPFGVRARLLDPECEQIDEAEELVVRDDGFMRDLGYPQGALMPDGRVLLTYYFNRKEEEGRHVYLAASILEEG